MKCIWRCRLQSGSHFVQCADFLAISIESCGWHLGSQQGVLPSPILSPMQPLCLLSPPGRSCLPTRPLTEGTLATCRQLVTHTHIHTHTYTHQGCSWNPLRIPSTGVPLPWASPEDSWFPGKDYYQGLGGVQGLLETYGITLSTGRWGQDMGDATGCSAAEGGKQGWYPCKHAITCQNQAGSGKFWHAHR